MDNFLTLFQVQVSILTWLHTVVRISFNLLKIDSIPTQKAGQARLLGVMPSQLASRFRTSINFYISSKKIYFVFGIIAKMHSK